MHTENKSIAPSEKACLLVSHRRPCPIGRDNSLWKQVKSKTPNKHRLGLFKTESESKSSPTEADFKRHEFQANYDRRKKQKLSETIESQREELHRAQADELHRRDQQLLHEQLLQQNLELREAHEEKSQ